MMLVSPSISYISAENMDASGDNCALLIFTLYTNAAETPVALFNPFVYSLL